MPDSKDKTPLFFLAHLLRRREKRSPIKTVDNQRFQLKRRCVNSGFGKQVAANPEVTLNWV
ncbi:MAG: hypothetical protein LH679_23930 [Cyanobacteria bacterium CAN_BIN43]|nr:hypothetical protein [Cyanobacteria bacterium CAN_BIN43]